MRETGQAKFPPGPLKPCQERGSPLALGGTEVNFQGEAVGEYAAFEIPGIPSFSPSWPVRHPSAPAYSR
jgi:hypothetical protein